MWDRIGQRRGTNLEIDDKEEVEEDGGGASGGAVDDIHDQTEIYKKNSGKCHWDYLFKELEWMADDFTKETKDKHVYSKKFVKLCKKWKNEQEVK